MKNYIHTILCWLSLISLLVSIATFCIFGVRIEPFRFSNDGVVGTMATLIGVCSTVMVGWQIFSSMQVRSELKEAQDLIKKLEGKLSKVNSTIDEQNKELEDEKGRRQKQNELIFARMQQTKGYAFGYMQILSAYYYFIEALTIFLKHEATADHITVLKDLSVCVLNMDTIIKNSNEAISNNQEADLEFIRKINYNNLTVKLLDDPKESPIEKLKMLPNYIIVKDKIEKYEAERKRIVLEAKKIRETKQISIPATDKE